MRKIIVFLLTLVAVVSTTAQAQMGDVQQKEMEVAQGMEVMLSIYSDVNLFYVDEVDPQKMVKDAMKGMLTKLDPYTEYIPKEDMDDFEFATTGKYGGIGSLIRQNGEWVEISEPYEGTPAAKAGLKAGDRLLEIDGESLHNASSAKVSSMLKGDPNTKFTLVYRPIADTTTTKTVEIERERIVVPGVPYYGVLSDSVGYIRLSNFTKGCAVEVKNAFTELKKDNKINSLVLDLRGNGGGVVGEAVDILNMFLPQNTEVLQIKGKVKEMNSSYITKNSPMDLDIPLVVLVNSMSASASEIVAGALQDLDRAVVMGSRSFGKGLVQSPRDMPYDGMLKVTIAKYYTPSGRSIQMLDYTHRKDDGSVGHIPDSLIKEYYTKNGRKVYNGGGIVPDEKIEVEYLTKFSIILSAYGFIDDFANLYAAKNAPVEQGFKVDDKIYAEFSEFIKDKEIEYESGTMVKLKALREMAELEKYDERILEELDSIEEKIKDDRTADLIESREDIVEFLESAILTRWFFSARAIEHSLGGDKVVEQAVELLEDEARYQTILKEQDTEKQ